MSIGIGRPAGGRAWIETPDNQTARRLKSRNEDQRAGDSE